MAHTRVADDFQAIRARLEELRSERERTPGTETEGGSVEAPGKWRSSNYWPWPSSALSFDLNRAASKFRALSSARRAGPEPAMNRGSGPWIDKPTQHTRSLHSLRWAKSIAGITARPTDIGGKGSA